MLDYVDCNIQAHIICDKCELYYSILYVIYDNISLYIITQSFFCFFYEALYHTSFFPSLL